ncbi:structural protein [Roseococcus pinisoli]|uniref:Structural protein n=1 Tax=Roseococcus pinisoli TaxID=2835040 RepID=A0ABS5QE54_9PROT|nr:structural protein [Roseococcus pinisoli]MBS7811220.1 structural protein [Roseococcus pinisoli]
MADPTLSRGYRNRNPGNIDWSAANNWQGQTGMEPAPVGGRARFATFQSHEYGIRALAMLLTTYQDRHGLRTIRAIVSRWAPSAENHTDAYAGRVADLTGFDPDLTTLDLHTYAYLRPLVEAIITVELGGQPYPGSVIDEGLRLAGVPRPVETVVQAAVTQTGQGALTVAGIGAAAAAIAPALQAIGTAPQWTGVAVVVAALVLALVLVLRGRRDA